ncbi:MAG: hypothetical protein K2M93_07050 [Muribaculaceae bacterium]|nr:hypothetical protein [Muribaculaceae bacterium]
MKMIFRHIKTLLCLALAVIMTACGSHNDMPQNPADEQGAFLVCNIGMVGATRGVSLPANETMQSLRILVLDNNGVLESNEYIDFNGARENYYHIVHLKSRTRKKLYILANEESVTSIRTEPGVNLSGSLHDYLEELPVGTKDFEAKIAAINYVPDFSKAIPLNAVYEVEVPADEKYIQKEFWLVRVATKFTFTFINNRKYDDLTIERFEVNGLSDRHFFMPKFTDNKVPVFPGFDNWIDWLKDVSDKSQANPDSPTADQSGWLTGYDIPSTAKPRTLTYNQPFTLKPPASPGTQGGGREISNIYCCESKNLRSGDGNTVAGEQQYQLTVVCTSDGVQKTFNVPLPNLRALFRNTHPHVIVTMNDGPAIINAVVDVVPYRGCILDPYFGLPRD